MVQIDGALGTPSRARWVGKRWCKGPGLLPFAQFKPRPHWQQGGHPAPENGPRTSHGVTTYLFVVVARWDHGSESRAPSGVFGRILPAGSASRRSRRRGQDMTHLPVASHRMLQHGYRCAVALRLSLPSGRSVLVGLNGRGRERRTSRLEHPGDHRSHWSLLDAQTGLGASPAQELTSISHK